MDCGLLQVMQVLTTTIEHSQALGHQVVHHPQDSHAGVAGGYYYLYSTSTASHAIIKVWVGVDECWIFKEFIKPLNSHIK